MRFGLGKGTWVTAGANIVDTPSDVDFSIAELEGPGDYDGIANALPYLPTWVREKPHAVVTNFNTVTAERAAPLVEAGFACVTEAYVNVNPNATPENMDREARARGWSYSVPCFGLWSGPADLYDPWLGWEYGTCGYLAEHVL